MKRVVPNPVVWSASASDWMRNVPLLRTRRRRVYLERSVVSSLSDSEIHGATGKVISPLVYTGVRLRIRLERDSLTGAGGSLELAGDGHSAAVKYSMDRV